MAADKIKKRYDMEDPVLSKLYIIKPENAISHAFREKTPSLLPLIQVLPRIVSEDNFKLIQTIDDQWRKLPIAVAFSSVDVLSLVIDSNSRKTIIDSFW